MVREFQRRAGARGASNDRGGIEKIRGWLQGTSKNYPFMLRQAQQERIIFCFI
jgi:hypothetical protein